MKKKMYIVAIAIILIGIVLMAFKGLVFDLNYSESEQIQIDIGKEFDIKEVEQICKEVFSKQKVILNKVSDDENSVSIRVRDYTDEQLLQINDKINEKYELSKTVDDIQKSHNSNVRGRDILKHFMFSTVLATIIIIIYVMIKYRKLGVWKTAGELILKLFLSQVLLLNVYSITRLPISRITMSISLVVYIVVLVVFTYSKEKLIRKEDAKQNKN